MAELVLKVGDYPDAKGYQDGDIICAFNQRRIRCTHAQYICHIRDTAFNGDGLNVDGIARKYQEFTYQYKFERVSEKEIKRIELSSMKEEVFSNIPNVKGEHIYVAEYIRRRLLHSIHRIFGTKDNEFWYGGNTDVSNTIMDNVWTMIEADTVNRESDFTLWPLTVIEKRGFLGLKINDFSEAEAMLFVESEYKTIGEEKILQKKRRRSIDWQSLILPASKSDIQDKTKSVDIREQFTLNKVTQINTKPLGII